MSRLRLKGATGLILIFVITASFTGLILKQKNAALPITSSNGATDPTAVFNHVPYDLLTIPNPTLSPLVADSVPNVNAAETPVPVLTNSTRAAIFDFAKANPGVQFRGICSELGLSIGLAQFHLGVLTRAGLISFFRDGKYKRFFEAKRFSKKQMKIISILRHETAGNILRTILKRKHASHSELACELSITSQGLTWHINRLEKEGLIQDTKDGMKTIYSIENSFAPMLTEMSSVVGQA